MDVIPVIDLKNGAVVHARRGERSSYQPISTPLVGGADPLVIADALIALAPFRRLYVADLDAIAGEGSHDAEIVGIKAAYPVVELWTDCGKVDPAELSRRAIDGPATQVVGSEAFDDIGALASAIEASKGVLSLDHDSSGRMGPDDIYESASLWPERVIVMTLANVGTGVGPDFVRLREVMALAGDRQVYAAGGVRGIEDLERLADMGVAGALVASAIHDGRLSGRALRTLLEAQP